MSRAITIEIDHIEPKLKEFSRSILVPLRSMLVKWKYGNDEKFPAWVFADFGERNAYAAYRLGGYGASGNAWGLVFSNEKNHGMDASCYSSFEEMIMDG